MVVSDFVSHVCSRAIFDDTYIRNGGYTEKGGYKEVQSIEMPFEIVVRDST